MDNQASNPLQKYFRQPKLYIRLPSSGNFYPQGSLERTGNNEYPVYAMTAKDELTIKTPDALLNGQSTVDVIQSCMPNIKDGWNVPSIDIDAILIAIRIATYGEGLELAVTLPNTDIVKEFTTDLRLSLDTLLNATFDTTVKLSDELTLELQPLTYRQFTQSSIKAVEEQRLFSVVSDSALSDEDKLERYNKSFKKLTELNIGSVTLAIAKVNTPTGSVTDRNFIEEFIANAEKDYFQAVVKHLEIQRDGFQLRPFKITTTPEEQEAGAPAEFETPIALDAANFFV
jgi:hypothetical protein